MFQIHQRIFEITSAKLATDGFAHIKVEKNIFSPISQEFVGFIGIILG